MQKVIFVIVMLFTITTGSAQDIFTRGLVYQEPAMKKVLVKEGNTFRTVNDTALKFDIYYPPSFAFKQQLPLVIFNNGVGVMDLHRWGIYKDWARLMAANGMIAITHQSRSANVLPDCEALVDYLLQNAKTLNIDTAKMGMWTCSANTPAGMRLAHKSKPANIKALVVYYGMPDSLGQLRQDLPTLLVRAGLDGQFINTGIEAFVQASLQQDARLEFINYFNGIHAFDAFTPMAEAKDIIVRTAAFFKKHLSSPVTERQFVLTNKNFMWLIRHNQLQKAVDEFRKARTMYRADSNFQPFFNAVIREDVLNENAYSLLNSNRRNEAVELFKLAVESYPESPNAHESLSEGYEAIGKKEDAIRHAEICLQKLPAATGMNENFKKAVKQSAEQRIQRLKK